MSLLGIFIFAILVSWTCFISTRLPLRFDSREEWGRQCPSLFSVRDQGACSSCWAVATASVMSDRLCIESKGEFRMDLSAQELVSCCEDCPYYPGGGGCDGGVEAEAWKYLAVHGLVTGNEEGCYPYEFEGFNWTGYVPNDDASSEEAEWPAYTPQCWNECVDTPEGLEWSLQGTKPMLSELETHNHVSIDYGFDGVKSEIFYHGPVTGVVNYYIEMSSYQGGVFDCSNVTEHQGTHVVRILGWDRKDGVEVWVMSFNYGKTYGENGLFYLKMIEGECGFYSWSVVAGQVLSSTTRNTGTTEQRIEYRAWLSPWCFQIQSGNVSAITAWILDGGDINARCSTDETPLVVAVRNGEYDITALLLKHGADVNQAMEDSTTPLSLARESGFSRIVALLLKNGAEEDALYQ